MKNKKNFEEPTLNIIKFDRADVIATSGEDYNKENNPTPTLTEFNIFG